MDGRRRQAPRARAARGSAPRSSARSRAASTPASSCATCCRATRARARADAAPRAASASSCSTSATTSPRCGATSCAPCSRSWRRTSHVVGLTATPPDELTSAEAELYDGAARPGRLHRSRRPAVVRDGHLAPYQELAWLTEPLSGERDWLAEHDTRFRELVTDAARRPTVAASPAVGRSRGCVSAAARPTTRPRCRGRLPAPPARSSPAPACASSRSAGLPLPPGAPRGEAYRQPPDLDDWLVLLEDCALRCLDAAGRARRRPRAARRSPPRCATSASSSPAQGIRRGGVGRRPAADRLGGEAARRWSRCSARSTRRAATGLRALVLCDAELAGARPDGELRGVLDPDAGTARAARARAGRRRPHRRRCARCSSPAAACAARPHDAELLLDGAARRGRGALDAGRSWEAEPDGADWSRCARRGAEWRPRALGRARHAAVRRRARRGCWSAPARCSARAGTRRA